ncbi:MAG: 16S rRNA (cytidine(1402)-2'-O)-methyltransferase [Elusimicrobiota bacterium]
MTLFIVSTPIGNLEDLSPRARRVLAEADAVACEDTRRTLTLLTYCGLRKPLLRHDAVVERREAPRLVERLQRGEKIALVTDAGTPGVSDPGFLLVRAALDAGVAVVPIPGPSAVLAALAGSGLPMDRFSFLGFLPRRAGRMKRELEKAGAEQTLVFFESPFRVKETLAAAREVFGDVPAAVGRELTKIHEEFIRGPLSLVLENLSARKEIKGEVAVVLAPQLKATKDSERREQ